MSEKEPTPPVELPMDQKIGMLFDGFYSSFRAFNSSLERSSTLLARAIAERDSADVLNDQLSREVKEEKRKRENAEDELKEYKIQWVSGWSMCSLIIIVGIILFAFK